MHRLRTAIRAVSHIPRARSSAGATTIKQAAGRQWTSDAASVPASVAMPRRALNTAAPPSKPRLFGFPFGLDDHDTLIANYRQAITEQSGHISATEAMADLQSTLRTEAHALELEEALQGKCSKASPSSTSTTSLIELASRTELWGADVQSIVADLTVERVVKGWVIHSPAMSSSNIAGVRFESNWNTSLHSIRRELAPHAFHAKLTATPFTVTADNNNDAQEDNTVVTDQPSMLLLDVNESDRSRVDASAITSLRVSLAPEMSPRDFAWFLSFLASHPTDLAFDVFSECMLREDKQSNKSNNK